MRKRLPPQTATRIGPARLDVRRLTGCGVIALQVGG
jgi:hypothetical protein